MTNHVHLLAAPSDTITGLGQLMKTLATRAPRYRNRHEGRSGTLWESRYKPSPVDSGGYLLACCRYIELNPVRAQMVKAPEDDPWSSYRQRMGMNIPAWLNLDPCYLELGPTEVLRRQRYQQFVRDTIPEGEWIIIRGALQRGQLTGSQRFIDEVEHIRENGSNSADGADLARHLTMKNKSVAFSRQSHRHRRWLTLIELTQNWAVTASVGLVTSEASGTYAAC